MDGDIDKLEDEYISATTKAIKHGMLQDSLEKIEPKTIFKILGPGKHRYPVENTHHHVDGGAHHGRVLTERNLLRATSA